MHLALTLALGVLFIIHVQSNECDVHIDALITYFHDAAGHIKEDPALYTLFSDVAKKVTEIKREKEKLKNQKSECHQVYEMMKDVLQKVESNKEKLRETKAYQENSNASDKIDRLIKFMEKIENHPKLPGSID
ncbi:hypothetical protein ACH3XW_21440 [Acanthocheilonema viteae]|uniref:SXP/RAL-2 family protein Ani s 5-like cation-binding domain-containing protein n=1 Tax=Acanthocheilonema viteae TaxID=6277 RepID=A0A498S2R1_ACAVI|nr:unnamed protein product [Acanthocheilonema viteae]